MPINVEMPRLSDTMDRGTIARWLKHEGEAVSRGDIIAEIETDKSNMEMESYAAGILAQILVGEGESAGLGEIIAVIAANETEAASLQAAASASSSSQQSDDATSPAVKSAAPIEDGETVQSGSHLPAQAAPEVAETRQLQGVPPADAAHNNGQSGTAMQEGRVKASPLARRLAQEQQIDLSRLTGTGPNGRITKDDVQTYSRQAGNARLSQAPEKLSPQAAQPASRTVDTGGLRATRRVDMTRMQQTIARRMTEARFSAPDFVLTAEIDMTEARGLLRNVAASEGAPKVGPNDLLIKAVAQALTSHPEANSGWEDDGIVWYGRINIGVAVAIPGGLVVPVIHEVNKKSLGAIAREAKELIEKARTNKLMPNEYEGGTFSISNLGMYGIDQFTPIINAPEACILGVGAIVQKPVVIEGEIVVRDRMRITLSCDHRVVNGAQGAEFLQTIRHALEHPLLTLL